MVSNSNISQNKQVQEFVKKTKDEIEKRTGKTPEQLFQEREKRVTDAIQLKIPDRIPVCFRGGFFPLRYAGLPPSAPFYNPVAYIEAAVKTMLDFEPDIFRTTSGDDVSGFALEALGDKQLLWPGGPLRNDEDAQFIDMQIMKEDEYDLFITDPGDFILRYYLPRRYLPLAALSKLPPLQALAGTFDLATQSTRFSSPEVVHAFEAIFTAGQEQARTELWHQSIGLELGFPPLYYPGNIANSPFDYFVTYLRGLRGTMVDMFRRPEKLLKAMERVMEYRFARAAPAGPKEKGRRIGAGGNHFQSEEFLSRKQFDTFVWPAWKKSMMAAIELGFVPSPFMEGKNDDRVECLLELPRGKALIHFEKIDIARAKNMLGDHLCIMGGVPVSLLWGGSPQEVEDYCKNLIRTCGKNGGFILNCTSSLDDAKPANVKAMVDSVKKYGRYY